MKKITNFFFAATALSMTLASCSNEENVSVNTPAGVTETSYAKIQIHMPGIAGTRAFGESGSEFDSGTLEEASVKKLQLLIYDDNGYLIGTGNTSEIQFSNHDASQVNGNSVSDNKSTIVKLEMNSGNANPSKIIAVVNGEETFETLNEALKAVTKDIKSTDGSYIMTNSCYYNGTDFVVGADINASQIYSTEELANAAEASKIDIYVERLAAKVAMSEKQNLSKDEKTADVALYGVDGEKYTLVFNDQTAKWAVTGFAPSMYLLKNAYGSDLSWANDQTNHRSYWALGTLYNTTFETYTGESRPLNYVSANQVVSTNAGGLGSAFGGNPQYTREHTYGENAMNENKEFVPVLTGSSAIVVGQYVVEGKNAENFKNDDYGYDFYLARRGTENGKAAYTIYSKDDLVKRLYDLNGIKLAKTSDSSTELTDEDLKECFDVEKNELGQYQLKMLNEELYELNKSEKFDSEKLSKVMPVSHYKNGWTYFFAPIEHKGGDNKTVGSYGIVRNHSYNLTVNSITSLGMALDESSIGDDPTNSNPTDPNDPDNPKPDPSDPGDKPINPDPDNTKNAYIDATLNVMSWHISNQKVDL